MYDGALTFLKNVILYLVFFFGKLWIGDKVIWGCMYNLGGVKKNKMSQKEECESFCNQIKINHVT